MPSTDDTQPASAGHQPPACTSVRLDEWAAHLVDVWPTVSDDRDVVMSAGLFTEMTAQLLRGDLAQARAIAGRLHDLAEAAHAEQVPTWTCPACGDIEPVDLQASHECPGSGS